MGQYVEIARVWFDFKELWECFVAYTSCKVGVQEFVRVAIGGALAHVLKFLDVQLHFLLKLLDFGFMLLFCLKYWIVFFLEGFDKLLVKWVGGNFQRYLKFLVNCHFGLVAVVWKFQYTSAALFFLLAPQGRLQKRALFRCFDRIKHQFALVVVIEIA